MGLPDFLLVKKVGLGVFEKSQKGQNLYQNVILKVGSVKVVKKAWTIEVILLNRKIGFIRQITKLDFVERTIKPLRMQNLRHFEKWTKSKIWI